MNRIRSIPYTEYRISFNKKSKLSWILMTQTQQVRQALIISPSLSLKKATKSAREKRKGRINYKRLSINFSNWQAHHPLLSHCQTRVLKNKQARQNPNHLLVLSHWNRNLNLWFSTRVTLMRANHQKSRPTTFNQVRPSLNTIKCRRNAPKQVEAPQLFQFRKLEKFKNHLHHQTKSSKNQSVNSTSF